MRFLSSGNLVNNLMIKAKSGRCVAILLHAHMIKRLATINGRDVNSTVPLSLKVASIRRLILARYDITSHKPFTWMHNLSHGKIVEKVWYTVHCNVILHFIDNHTNSGLILKRLIANHETLKAQSWPLYDMRVISSQSVSCISSALDSMRKGSGLAMGL